MPIEEADKIAAAELARCGEVILEKELGGITTYLGRSVQLGSVCYEGARRSGYFLRVTELRNCFCVVTTEEKIGG
jgi:hypothetical protein